MKTEINFTYSVDSDFDNNSSEFKSLLKATVKRTATAYKPSCQSVKLRKACGNFMLLLFSYKYGFNLLLNRFV